MKALLYKYRFFITVILFTIIILIAELFISRIIWEQLVKGEHLYINDYFLVFAFFAHHLVLLFVTTLTGIALPLCLLLLFRSYIQPALVSNIIATLVFLALAALLVIATFYLHLW